MKYSRITPTHALWGSLMTYLNTENCQKSTYCTPCETCPRTTNKAQAVCKAVKVHIFSPRNRLSRLCITSYQIVSESKQNQSRQSMRYFTQQEETPIISGTHELVPKIHINCSKIAKPLTELTKNILFNWSRPASSTFAELEYSTINAPILAN